ncbi:hypothetical protein TYRP_012029 [Tyrophagus putrescentiae]|nr:hypothetical protein TYRP_012029 [Tyrophagus putrescentiae]
MTGWLLPIRSDHCLSYYCNNCSVLIYGAPVLHPPVLHPPLALLYYCSNTAKKALIRVFLFSLLLFPSCSSFFFSIFLTDLCSSVRARFVDRHCSRGLLFPFLSFSTSSPTLKKQPH